MANWNMIFGIYRVLIMGSVTIGSVFVLIMGALVISFTNNHHLGYFPYAALGLAVASLTLITLPVMLFLSIYRKEVFVNMILVELFWLGLLSILWVATGGTIASLPWLNYCATLALYYIGGVEACMETQAMAAFSFLNWMGVGGLWLVLISLAMLQASRGNGIWTEYVTHVDFFAPAPNTEVPLDPVLQHQYVSHPPQQYTSQLPQFSAPQQPQFVAPPQQLQYMHQVAQV
jgi:hypothetical protein